MDILGVAILPPTHGWSQDTQREGGHTGPVEGGTVQTMETGSETSITLSELPEVTTVLETWSLVNTENMCFKTTDAKRNCAKRYLLVGCRWVHMAQMYQTLCLPAGHLCSCCFHQPGEPFPSLHPPPPSQLCLETHSNLSPLCLK